MSKPRIRLPEQAKVGEVIEVKTLISHVMETGQRKEADGKPIPRQHHQLVQRKVRAARRSSRPSCIPASPPTPTLLSIMRVPGPGEFEFTWVDDAGAKIVEKQKLNVV